MRKTVVAILKKLLHTVILLLVLSFVVFSFIRLIPGDPVKISMGPMTPEERPSRRSAANCILTAPCRYSGPTGSRG